MNKLPKEALELIKEFEGCELKAYVDAVGVWTIGYGHTAMAGPPEPKKGMVITKQQAEDILKKDLVKYEGYVSWYVKVPLTDNQHGALTSLVYNIGPSNFGKSTLVKKLNRKDYQGAADQFLVWNRGGGRVLAGLTRRRKAERVLFLKGSQRLTENVQESEDTVQPVETKPSTRASNRLIEAFTKMLGAMFNRRK